MKTTLFLPLCILILASCASPAVDAPEVAARPTFGVHLISSDFDRPAAAQDVIDLGAGWVRINIGHHLGLKDQAMSTWLERVKPLSDAGIGIFATVYSRHKKFANHFPESDEELDRFQKGLDGIVTTLGPFVDIWQLENELTIDSHWPDHCAPHDRGGIYAKGWQRFVSRIRALDPGAEVTIFGLPAHSKWSLVREHYLTDLLRVVPEGFDVVDIHCHTSFVPDVELITGMKAAREMIRADLGDDVDLVSTEGSTWAGEPDGRPRQSELAMASHLVRKQLVLASLGVRFTCFGPLANRRAWKGHDTPHRFSLNGLYQSGPDGAPKLAVDAMRRVCDQWTRDGWARLELTRDGPRVIVSCLDRSGRVLATILWSKTKSPWTVPQEYEGHHLRHLAGKPRDRILAAGDKLPLSHVPILVTRSDLLKASPR